MRSAGATARAACTTCSTSASPPARCSTLACLERMRVPNPAAKITTVVFIASFSATPLKNECGPFSSLSLVRFLAPPALRQVKRHSAQRAGIVAGSCHLPRSGACAKDRPKSPISPDPPDYRRHSPPAWRLFAITLGHLARMGSGIHHHNVDQFLRVCFSSLFVSMPQNGCDVVRCA